MMKKLILILLGLTAATANAENFYVRSGGAGSRTGADWDNAWGINQITWGGGAGQVGAGDTVWVAGGNYGNTSVELGADGTSGSRIYIKRARASESACTSAAGWSAGFDATVQFDLSGTQPLGFYSGAGGDYTTIDGMIDDGMLFNMDHRNSPNATTTGCLMLYWNAVTGLEFRNAQVVGVQAANNEGTAEMSGMQLGAVTGIGGNTDVTIYNVEFMYLGTPIHLGRNNGVLIDRCYFHDNNNFGGTDHGDEIYAHLEYSEGPNNMTVRYCTFENNWNEGVYLAADNGDHTGSSHSGFYFHGNIWIDINGAGAKCISVKPGGATMNTIEIAFNTFDNCNSHLYWTSPGSMNGNVRNNIFYQGSPAIPVLTHDYNWFTSTTFGEANGQDGGAGDPFVNSGAGNYLLTSGTDPGFPLTSPTGITVDRAGTSRSTPDRGAFEFGSASAPVIVSNNIVGGALTNFSQQMVASGNPTNWLVSGLPASLSINSAGVISGIVTNAITNAAVTLSAYNSSGAGTQAVLATFYPLSASMWRSASTVTFITTLTNTTAQSSITVSNITGQQGTTLTGYVHQFAAPFSVSGDTNYSLTGVTTDTITFTYSPTAVGTNLGYATLIGDGNQTNTLYGSAAPDLGLHAVLAYGLLTAPMVSNANNWVGSTVEEEGTASFFFSLPVSGYYRVQATTSGATNGGNNSFYVSTKNETDFIWDIYEQTDGLNYVHKRGTGAFDAPQYTNYAITNIAGQQWLQFRGREICYLSNVVINFTATGGSDSTPPTVAITNPPTGTVVAEASYFGLSGTASDDSGVVSTVVISNATSGVSFTATGTSPNWTNDNAFTLSLGTNIFRAYAADTNSNSAVSSDVAVKYQPAATSAAANFGTVRIGGQ